MQPLRLCLKNFCGHSETEFSFNDFSSALVIGKVKNNDRFSNGAGKSTIFNSIEYVLFNEVHFSALEKVIRDGCDVCRVEFDFISSIDKATYRIIRSNSRKAGTDVRLSKQIENDAWEDLTQRRVSDTEKEIVKIVGFNYKAFCSSVLFSQFGSENNVQKDFGNLPNLTPEKRKSVLREVLQLNIYSNYEKLAKNKYSSIVLSLDKQKAILGVLDESDAKLVSLNKEKDTIISTIVPQEKSIKNIEKTINFTHSEYTILVEKISKYKSKIADLRKKQLGCQEQLEKSKQSIKDFKEKISTLPLEIKQIDSEVGSLSQQLQKTKDRFTNRPSLKEALDKIVNTIISNRSDINMVNVEIKECNKPITAEKICNTCHQAVSEEHKHNWMQKNSNLLSTLFEKKQALDAVYSALLKEKTDIEKEISDTTENEKKINNLTSVISSCHREIESKNILYKQYSSLLEDFIKTQEVKLKELSDINEELKKVSFDESANEISKVHDLKITLDKLRSELSYLQDSKNKLISSLAVINHQIEEFAENKLKILDIKNNIQELEKSLIIYSKVVQAFGSNGIPALITHSILDELQEGANKWLLKLRPGLQLQFVVENDKNNNNKEKEDTLDILYFIDGNQREYKQLSGAQKIIVSLSIKLGLLFVMNKRLGIDIKLILLDEVDQALDPGSTEIFAEIIKVIQDEFKVIVITHNDELKHKFSHAILVEQDENNVSKGKLINW